MKTSKEKDNMNDKYWKSIDELVEQPEFKNFVHNEFSEGTIELPNNISRKNFLYLMGASIAMAGFSGCRKPVRKILPYISAPEEIIPGIPNYYASSFSLGLNAFGVVVETHEGRPTHIEGNEKHSSSLGAVNQYIQSSILDLYDPDRAKNISNNDDDSDINDFIEYCHSYNYNDGKGMYVVSKTITSPTTYRLYKEFLKKFPKAMWIAYDTVNQENLINGIRVATDKNLIPRYKFDKAKTILSLESDFLSDHYDNINNCKTFSKSRKVGEEMNRLYVAESFVSSTGMMADHRFKIQSNDVVMLLSLLNNALLSKGVSGLERINNNSFKVNSKLKKFVEVVSDELILNKGKSIIMAGDNQPVEIHSLVYAINHSLSNNSKTIDYYNLDDVLLSNTDDMQDLMNQINLGNVKTLINLDVDLLYHFKNQINESKYKDIPNKISCSYHSDLTSKFSTWHVPLAHYMESWLDCKSIDGTLSVGQPMISPLYKDCLGINQILSIFLGNKNINDQDLIKKTWKKILGSQFSSSWNRVLHDGLLEGKYNSKYSETEKIKPELLGNILIANQKIINQWENKNLEIVFKASNATYDGRYFNNFWLRECPDPVTKISWENVAMLSSATAQKLGVKNKEMLTIKVDGNSIDIPAWIVPGHADNNIAVDLGYGKYIKRTTDRTYVEENILGFNTYDIKPIDSRSVSDVSVESTGIIYKIACTQDHHGLDTEKLAANEIEGRLPEIIREATLDEYIENKEIFKQPDRDKHLPDNDDDLPSLYPSYDYSKGPQWGMSIDLNACNGCNACTIACQSENNIPVVGKQQVYDGREMSWIRVDRYFKGNSDNPEFVNQPVSCVHCENAPCEQVCPVAATVHDEEGLNAMVYNRCIGTRYCSNNCPYKVRRFNFFNYTEDTPEIVQMAHNPDVTIRFRGVMEKCTYCVQRISEAKISASNNNTPLKDGDIKVACQSACPMDCIEFGDITDNNSRVSLAKKSDRNYSLLKELNTKPRTTYLSKVRNPNKSFI